MSMFARFKVLAAILAGAGVIIYVVLFSLRSDEVSLILTNGVFYTVNAAQPVAEAVAIRGDRIARVGSTKGILRSFTSSRVIDLKGRTVYPGFIDSHAHLEGLGIALMYLDLSSTASVKEIQDLVGQDSKRQKEGRWIRGRGWDHNRWQTREFPTHEMLDVVSGDVPVYLKRIDGHAAWVNLKVLELAGITEKTPDPEGGRIIRDKSGRPTGVFIDNAMDLLDSVVPAPSRAERSEAIQMAIRECLRAGLTEVHDMGVDLEAIDIYKSLIKSGLFPLRVYAAVEGSGSTWEHYMKVGPEDGGYEGRLVVRAVKFYADGALGSRGAALIEPYSDDPGNRGLTLTSSASLKQAAAQALDKGFQLCVHAIGDRANHIVLDVYEECSKSKQDKWKDSRFRVEHAQVLAPEDIPRFHRLGVIPVMQPTHCTSDMFWAEDRLGSKRVAGAYAWRSLLEQGSIIPGGSDFPVESPNPLWGFYAAITRQDQSGKPEGGWFAGQRMSREEALKAYTIWGAYAGFQEGRQGSIEPGKLADLVILSKDIMKVEPREILSTDVEATIVGGEVVYSNPAFIVERSVTRGPKPNG